MTATTTPTPTVEGDDLVITRRLKAAPDVIWPALTDAETLKRWFVPRPWRITRALIEPWPGGRFVTDMQGPDGEAEDCAGDSAAGGCVLLADPPRRLVWTDALSGGWRPNAQPFMTADVTLEPDGEDTILTARVLHHGPEDRARHEEMGFAQGWGAILDQLAELVERQ